MRRSLILNILCPSGRNIIICLIVLMILLSSLITFLLFDDITSSSVSIIHHIHSDVPHPWITDTLYVNHTPHVIDTDNQRRADKNSKKHKQQQQQQSTKLSSVLDAIHFGHSHSPLNFDAHSEMFVNAKSFSQVIEETFRPSLTDLLQLSNNALDLNLNHSASTPSQSANNSNRSNSGQNIYAQHLEWYSSKPIPHLLHDQLSINKHEIVSSKLIYHSQLQHFVLLTIKACKQKNNVSSSSSPQHKRFCLDVYERDAKPFLWRYAFDTKHFSQHSHPHDEKKRLRKRQKQNEYESKRSRLLKAIQNLEIVNTLELAGELLVADLKSIGLDLSLGYDDLDELKDILQELILTESTQHPSFKDHNLNEEGLQRNMMKNNIEQYINKKSEFYKAYYDGHADKIKVVYTDWYHTMRQEIDGMFTDQESLWKWSDDYRYLLIASYEYTQDLRKQSKLHLFQFEMSDNENGIERMKNGPLMQHHHRRNKKMSQELLDNLQQYGYYRSSSLNQILKLKSYQSTTKHVPDEMKSTSAMLTALTFTKCSVYYAIENDHKFIRAVPLSKIFEHIDDRHCYSEQHDDDDEVLTDNVHTQSPFSVEEKEENVSFYEYEDSMLEISKQYAVRTSVSHFISDLAIINESTLLLTKQTKYNSYYMSYGTLLLHIPAKYQHIDPNGLCSTSNPPNSVESKRNKNRWYIIDTRALYKDKLSSSQYYYRHEGKMDDFNHKFDRISNSWISNMHYTMSTGGITSLQRKKENTLQFQPSLFLSKSQNDISSIVTSTPYFISLNEKGQFDDTVEIVNIKSMTTFTQSALNRNGDLLAILDNTDSILVLKKSHPFRHRQNDNKNINDDEVVVLHELDALNDADLKRKEYKVNITKSDGSVTEIALKDLFMIGSLENGNFSALLQNEEVAEMVSQFVREQIMDDGSIDNARKDEIEWQVSVEFTPTSIMSHLKPINIICISPEEMKTLETDVSDQFDSGDKDEEEDITGYVVVLFEQGVIASYVIRGDGDGDYSAATYLANGAIDFWLETCIDWIELAFLMSFGIYFICSCCRRSRVRIGLGRERIINEIPNLIGRVNLNNLNQAVNNNNNNNGRNGDNNNNQARPRRGAVANHMMPMNNNANGNNAGNDANNLNENNIQPIHRNGGNMAPLVLNEMADPADDDNDDEEQANADREEIQADIEADGNEAANSSSAIESARLAAMRRYQNMSMEERVDNVEEAKEEKEAKQEDEEEKQETIVNTEENIAAHVQLFESPDRTQQRENGNDNEQQETPNRMMNVDLLSVNNNNRNSALNEMSSPLSPLSPAINPRTEQERDDEQ